MPPSKYERELRFIDTEVTRLNKMIRNLSEEIPNDPVEAARKAEQIEEMQEKIKQLNNRKDEILKSYQETGMQLPNIARSMNATVHNAGAFEIHSSAEAEELALAYRQNSKEKSELAPLSGDEELDDITDQIDSIGREINEIESRIIEAEIDGDDDEKTKLEMMVSSLRTRRVTLISQAKQLKAAQSAPQNAPVQAVDSEVMTRIEALEADSRALRSQISNVRSDMQDVKEQLRQIIEALGINRDDE